jgi:hypothetical protein
MAFSYVQNAALIVRQAAFPEVGAKPPMDLQSPKRASAFDLLCIALAYVFWMVALACLRMLIGFWLSATFPKAATLRDGSLLLDAPMQNIRKE